MPRQTNDETRPAELDIIAAVLVEDLMTVGGQRAERLVLRTARGTELGSWSAQGLEARIRRHLEPLEADRP